MSEVSQSANTVVGGVPTPASVFPPRNATNPTPPTVPEQDGKLVLKTIHGQEYAYEYKDMPNSWKPHAHYLSISLPHGWKRWPWGQILWFETTQNSREYVQAREARKRWDAEQHAKTEDEARDG